MFSVFIKYVEHSKHKEYCCYLFKINITLLMLFILVRNAFPFKIYLLVPTFQGPAYMSPTRSMEIFLMTTPIQTELITCSLSLSEHFVINSILASVLQDGNQCISLFPSEYRPCKISSMADLSLQPHSLASAWHRRAWSTLDQ